MLARVRWVVGTRPRAFHRAEGGKKGVEMKVRKGINEEGSLKLIPRGFQILNFFFGYLIYRIYTRNHK